MKRVGWLDMPGSAPHKVHSLPVPVAGGVVLFAAVFIPYALLKLPFDRAFVGIFIGAVGLTCWGTLDDRVGLRPYQKLLGQVAVALLLIGVGIQVRITRIPWLDVLLTLFWLTGMVNAFNFVDSMDGLALGLAVIASGFFMLVTIDSEQPQLSTLSAAILGASIGAYVFNCSPARMFLGDSGSQLLGFLLASIGIAYVPAGAGLPQGVSWFTPILVMGVPVFDMALVVLTRLWHRRPIYRGGRDHTYHRLVGLGVAPTRSVVLMHFVAILLGLIAFVALGTTVVVANVMFGVIVSAGLVLLWLFERLTPAASIGADSPAVAVQEE
jgi:UDP-GlcNAc:undecaprenyl-phosphate GlcNAc-1-phosphate transferase